MWWRHARDHVAQQRMGRTQGQGARVSTGRMGRTRRGREVSEWCSSGKSQSSSQARKRTATGRLTQQLRRDMVAQSGAWWRNNAAVAADPATDVAAAALPPLLLSLLRSSRGHHPFEAGTAGCQQGWPPGGRFTEVVCFGRGRHRPQRSNRRYPLCPPCWGRSARVLVLAFQPAGCWQCALAPPLLSPRCDAHQGSGPCASSAWVGHLKYSTFMHPTSSCIR